VKAGDQASHRAQRTVGRHHEAGPAFSRRRRPRVVRDGFQRSHDRCSDGDHAPAGALRGIDTFGGMPRYTEILFVRWLVAFEACHAGVEHQRRDLNTL